MGFLGTQMGDFDHTGGGILPHGCRYLFTRWILPATRMRACGLADVDALPDGWELFVEMTRSFFRNDVVLSFLDGMVSTSPGKLEMHLCRNLSPTVADWSCPTLRWKTFHLKTSQLLVGSCRSKDPYNYASSRYVCSRGDYNNHVSFQYIYAFSSLDAFDITGFSLI